MSWHTSPIQRRLAALVLAANLVVYGSVIAVVWKQASALAMAPQTVLGMALFAAAIAVALTLFVLYVVHRLVTRPIGALTRQMTAVGTSGELGMIDDELVRRRDEIGVLAIEFNRMVEVLADSRQKLQNKSYAHGMAEMASGVLHNIRNALSPLTVGIWKIEATARGASLGRIETALAELAQPDVGSERRRKLVAYLHAAAEKQVLQQRRIADEIAEIGQHSQRIEQILQDVDLTGRRRRQLEAIDLDRLVEECAHLIPSREGPSLVVEIDPVLAGLPAVRGNRVTLSQVIGNLLINAAESIRSAGIAAGKIEVTAAQETVDGKDMIHLEVRDNGGGIEPDVMASLFQRGFSTKRGMKGGIGLHWCANSVIAIGGRIHATSDGKGKGATFHLLLPKIPAPPGLRQGRAA